MRKRGTEKAFFQSEDQEGVPGRTRLNRGLRGMWEGASQQVGVEVGEMSSASRGEMWSVQKLLSLAGCGE